MASSETAPRPSARLSQLDSLRGLASMAVVLEHCIIPLTLVHQVPPIVTWIGYTPLAVFFASYQAVLFFFILSGFVLAIPFYDARRKPTYRGFLAKRVLRLYPALWATLGLAFAARWIIDGSLAAPKIIWPNGPHSAFNPGEVLQHLLLIFNPDNTAYDQVIWSLVHEIRLSLVLPLIAFGIARGYGRQLLLLGLPVAAVGFFFGVGTANVLGTLFYGYLFTCGAYLAFERRAITAWLGRLPAARQCAIAALAVVLYLAPSSPLVEGMLPWRVFANLTPWLAAIGAAGFLIIGIGVPAARRMLDLPPIHFLGTISYSLYLVHAVVLYALLDAWAGTGWPLWSAVVLTPVISVPLAWLFYVFVERPGIRAGYRLAAVLNSLSADRGRVEDVQAA